MRIVNLTVGGCMIALAIAQILSSDDAFSAMADALSIIYTMYVQNPLYFVSSCSCTHWHVLPSCRRSFFALILIGYELRTKFIDNLLRESFGFMYSPWGRCLFLSMISIFPFGMVGVYGVLVSFAGFLNAYFNFFVITKVSEQATSAHCFARCAITDLLCGAAPVLHARNPGLRAA